jgi:tetratricopeptide (TPR) repeat protein
MPRVPTKTSRAVGDLLRQKRTELHLTLQAVSQKLGEQGDAIPTSTLTRIEQGKLDPGVLRLHRLLRLYKVPPHLVADLIEIEEGAVEPPIGGDLATVLREGVDAWKRGDLPKGLAHLLAVRKHVPDGDASRLLRQKATLDFAVAARTLGKLRLAKQILEDLLLERPDASLVTGALVLGSTVWAGLGSPLAAAAFIHEAERRLDEKDSLGAAWVLHQKAKVLLAADEHAEAAATLERAVAWYRKAGDTYGEGRASLTRIALHEARGALTEAVECARSALSFSDAHDHAQLAGLARIELGRLLVRGGSTEAGLEALRTGLADAMLRRDQNAQFTAHFHLWKAHESLGDLDRARLELEAATYFVRFVDDQSPESLEIHRLQDSKRRFP